MSDTNEKTLAQAASAAKVRGFLSKLTPAGLRELRTQLVNEDRRVAVYTPWEWADEAGVYYGQDGAWLFHALPVSVLTAGSATLQALMDHLARALKSREVHFLNYQWEEQATVPEGLSAAHRDYLINSLRLLVPGQMLVVGVKLVESDAAQRRRAGFPAVYNETIEKVLGEWVPELGDYADDVATISEILTYYGGKPPAGNFLDMLESWYSLGVAKDYKFEETDDAIVIRGSETIEMVSVRSFADVLPAAPTPPPSPGAGGTLVVSARGILEMSKSGSSGIGDDQRAMLREASIVMGRHVLNLVSTLHAASQDLVGAQYKPLPMRQMPALLETLPCAEERVDANLFRVDARKLALAGFNEPVPAGDRSGILIGMVEPNFSYPLYLDFFATPGRCVAVAGDGETDIHLLVEHIAAQARLSRRRVLFVNHATDFGKGLVDTPEAPEVIAEPVPGMLDPFTHLGPEIGPVALVSVLRHAFPEWSEDDLTDLTAQLSRAGLLKMTTATAATRLIPDKSRAAALVKFSKTPAGRMLFATEGAEQVNPTVAVWNVPTLLAGIDNAGVRDALCDVMLAVAHYKSRGGLLITDADLWRRGPVTNALFNALGSSAGSLLATVAHADTLLRTDMPTFDTAIVLGHAVTPPAAFLASKKVKNLKAVQEWLANSHAYAEEGVILAPDRGFMFDARGNRAAILVGPVPKDRILAYTRQYAFAYQMDTSKLA